MSYSSRADGVARTMGHVLFQYPELPSGCRGMLQVGFAAIRLWETTPLPGRHQAKVCPHLSSTKARLTDRFAHMIAKVEAQQAWLENITYQMCNMVSRSSGCIVTSSFADRVDIQGTIQEPSWTDCVPQDAVDSFRRRDRRRGRQHFRWSRSDQNRNG